MTSSDGRQVQFPNQRGSDRPVNVVTWRQHLTWLAGIVGGLGTVAWWVVTSVVDQRVAIAIKEHSSDPFAHAVVMRTVAAKEEINARLDKIDAKVDQVSDSVARIEGRLGREARNR